MMKMKKLWSRLILMLAISAAVFGGKQQVTKAATVKKITWSNVKSKKNMYAKRSARFKVKISPTKAKNSKLQWFSSNKKVATVDSTGKVTTLKPGTTKITCRIKAQKSRRVVCKLTVKKKLVSKIAFTTPNYTIQTGKTVTQRPVVTPTYAYNQNMDYTSSNTKVATVSSSGKVKGIKQGTVTITATTKDGSKKKATYKVRVVGTITKDSAKFIAHRGLSSQAPENTVKAFELAGQAGFYGAECDVMMTKDGEFIINHDTTFERMCGVDRRPIDMTLEEVKKLKIITGNNYSTYKNDTSATTIATLEEYLNVCKEYNMVPVIEVKMEYDTGGKAKSNLQQGFLENDMLALHKKVKSIMGSKEYRYIGYDLQTILTLQEVLDEEDLLTKNVTFEHVTNSPDQGMVNYYKNHDIGLDANYTQLTSTILDLYQEGGVHVNVWTADDVGDVWDLMQSKVDSITTNQKFW